MAEDHPYSIWAERGDGLHRGIQSHIHGPSVKIRSERKHEDGARVTLCRAYKAWVGIHWSGQVEDRELDTVTLPSA